MGRKRREWRIEVVGEPPADLSPEAIHFFATWMADLHEARMQAEGTAPPGRDAVTAAEEPSKGEEDGSDVAAITAERDAAREEVRRLRMEATLRRGR